eukprot:GHVH01005068.1.p1 GENE.GHVH01005068.1~~GHVH01005068.1.p1  ORF type:complete len:536 (+),score=64.69 GHVH01005068.1:1643-3250(+)
MMQHGTEFEHGGLWYGWDEDSSAYWAWCDVQGDWVEYIEDAATELEDAVEEIEEEMSNAIAETSENIDASDIAIEHPSSGSNLYYVASEEVYYYDGGIVEYDEEWCAYYYYTNPNDPEEYDWIPEELSNLSLAIEVACYDDMPKKVADTDVPADMKRASSVDFENTDSPPDLYFDQLSEQYFYLGLRVHFKKDSERYYIVDQIRKDRVDLPKEHVQSIVDGTVAVWNSVATSSIAAPSNLHLGEPETEQTELETVEELENLPPKKVDIPRPVVTVPSGTLFSIRDSDLATYNAGTHALTHEQHPSLFNEELRDHFHLSRWGDYLVGRCRKTFGNLIRGDVLAEELVGRLPELTTLVQNLSDLQLLMIWKNNCASQKWTHAAEESIRQFAFKIERSVPFLVFARCLMCGYDSEEGSTAFYVNKYYPKEKVRVACVEKTQKAIRGFDETHVKNMGRVIILAHGAIDLEPRLKEHVVNHPWWQLPTIEDDKNVPRVYYNCKTRQAFLESDFKKPDVAVKLVITFRPTDNQSGIHVCRA